METKLTLNPDLELVRFREGGETMKGWFDAFRTDGGPTLYDFQNRTAVQGDITLVVICLTFGTIFAAFLIIFPGIRKARVNTALMVAFTLLIGFFISISACSTSWHVARARILSPYRAFSHDKIFADFGVYIGLNSVNITLKAIPVVNQTPNGIDYNERFSWIRANEMREEYKNALVKGLPFPILTVVEYLSLDSEGFCWGGAYRQAGYYSYILLWASVAVWLLMNVLFCVVPRYGAYTMALLGVILVGTNIVYYFNLPPNPLVVPFEDSVFLRFSYGWSFWTIMVTGLCCFLAGLVIAIVDLICPHKFSTILEVDYGTPFDRHIILHNNSNNHSSSKSNKAGENNKPKSIIEVAQLDQKAANNNEKIDHLFKAKDALKRNQGRTQGFENRAFEDDQKPWRFRQDELNKATGQQNRNRKQSSSESEVQVDVQAANMW